MAVDATHPVVIRYRDHRKEREKLARIAEKDQAARNKVRKAARDEARTSEDGRMRQALRLAESGFGVLHIITATGIDGAFVRMLVLGEDR